MKPKTHQALWWKSIDDEKTQCFLCPRNCLISPGNSGFCGVRGNRNGQLITLAYGTPVALHIDPIEKKPLAEFMPGSKTFSIGTFGCNLNCIFCQNHSLSRGKYSSEYSPHDYYSPESIVDLAEKQKCRSIAFTYNEPTVFAEYAIDIATLAKKSGLATVLVSNGFISLEAAKDLYPLIDAANIDMKGFSEDFYREMTGMSLAPVLEAIEYYYSLGNHLELTNLVIPDKNDDMEMIDAYLDWVKTKLSTDIPLHFSAYHPAYRFNDSPPTDPKLLYRIREHAQKSGFSHIYLGNIPLYFS